MDRTHRYENGDSSNDIMDHFVRHHSIKMHLRGKLQNESKQNDSESRAYLQHQGFAEMAVNALEQRTLLDVDSEPWNTRHTSIICTLGPASQSVDMLQKMIDAGMNIARLNFSHGSHEYHKKSIENVRMAEQLSTKRGRMRPVAIALDTKGPEIRTGVLTGGANSEINLQVGMTVRLTIDEQYESSSTLDNIYVDYKNIVNIIKEGNRVYMDDGLISLLVRHVGATHIECEVENGGTLGSRKGINLPGVPIDLPAVSEKDRRDIEFAVENNLDIIFASFIRDVKCVEEIRNVLGEKGKYIKLIAKIENYQGIQNFDEILKAVDGIMVARGDMGIEIPPQKVFVAQKMMIAKCNLAGKPVICATQMLESMIKNPRPTRAEVSDVANAVLDNADCIMLSGESAKGRYPVQCVQLMHEIAREAEACLFHRELFENLRYFTKPPLDQIQSSAIAAVEAAFRSFASIIVVLTHSGRSAHLISQYRPRAVIMAVTRSLHVARQIHLFRGCCPVYIDEPRSSAIEKDIDYKQHNISSTQAIAMSDWLLDVDKRVNEAIKVAKQRGFCSSGDAVIVVTGWRPGSGTTNTLRIIYAH